VVVWGNPADPSHNPLRGHCVNNSLDGQPLTLGACDAEGAEEKPFLRLPSDCASPMVALMSFNVWPNPTSFASALSASPAPGECEAVPFAPGFATLPETSAGDAPTGMVAKVHIPQPQEVDAPASADLRKTVVTLPEGLLVNPATANGLAACTPEQIGLTSAVGAEPATFTSEAAACPEAAKLGTVEVSTPVLDHPLSGGVYAASPDQNPFGTLLALYIAVDDPETGVVLKLPGRVDPDPKTGQITATFDNTPQQPFEDFELHFFGGPQASLRTPATCGAHSSAAQMTPWSAPASGPPAELTSTFQITSSCAASAAELPHKPSLRAGTTNPTAGAFSPLVVNLARDDGSQELAGLSLTAPDGLTGKLAGIPYCSEASLAAAAEKSGKEELQSPSCPGASRLGSVDVGAGAGPEPYFTQGQIYLAPPYKGAPISLAIITPAVAGPFDLGTVVVRTALQLNPETARITAASDPLPEILEGIPLDVREVAVKLDRPGFTLNPTDCSALSFTGTATSTEGQAAELKDGFQVDGCRGLGFKPKLSLKLFGGVRRSAHPRLRAILRMPAGGANIQSVSVALPHSEFLDQGSIGTICTRVQFAAEACPEGSVYGKVVATTPLLDYPLEGPVYLRSSDNELPDLVPTLHGPADQPIKVASPGRIDTLHGGIRTSFESFPDVPISKVVLSMRGGKRKGLIENSTNICARKNRAIARFSAQNGRAKSFRPVLHAQCKGKRAKKRSPAR